MSPTDTADGDAAPFRFDVHVDPTHLDQALRADVLDGLSATPKSLPPKWFYDETGSELFEEITRLPEYYPTRREAEILAREATTIADVTGADTLVELGAGSGEKTRIILSAMQAHGSLSRFVPFDVSESFLRSSAKDIAVDYPGIQVHGVAGDFDHHLDRIPHTGRRLVAFLGGTIGNFEPASRKEFLNAVATSLDPGDAFLLGTDLVKDPARLVAAYDDSAGVTAAFNRNVLAVLNRRLDADFAIDRFEHVALWDSAEEWIEMRLRSLDAAEVNIAALDKTIHLEADEEIRTEISAKFTRARVESELADVGLQLRHWWTDDADDYALSLSTVSE